MKCFIQGERKEIETWQNQQSAVLVENIKGSKRVVNNINDIENKLWLRNEGFPVNTLTGVIHVINSL